MVPPYTPPDISITTHAPFLEEWLLSVATNLPSVLQERCLARMGTRDNIDWDEFYDRRSYRLKCLDNILREIVTEFESYTETDSQKHSRRIIRTRHVRVQQDGVHFDVPEFVVAEVPAEQSEFSSVSGHQISSFILLSSPGDGTWKQMVEKARSRLLSATSLVQFHRPFHAYALGILVCGNLFALSYADVSGMAVSKPKDISDMEGMKGFVELILSLIASDSLALGRDPSVRLEPASSPHAYPTFSFPLESSTPPQLHRGQTHDEPAFWTTIGPPLFVSTDLFGIRAATWSICQPGKRGSMDYGVLRMGWRTGAPQAASVHYTATATLSGSQDDQDVTDLRVSSFDCRALGPEQSVIDRSLMDANRRCHLVRVFITTESPLKALSQYTNPSELEHWLAAAIKAHERLRSTHHVMLNICPGSMLFSCNRGGETSVPIAAARPSTKVMLTDVSQGPMSDDGVLKTNDLFFLASDLVRVESARPKVQEYHVLESFIWTAINALYQRCLRNPQTQRSLDDKAYSALLLEYREMFMDTSSFRWHTRGATLVEAKSFPSLTDNLDEDEISLLGRLVGELRAQNGEIALRRVREAVGPQVKVKPHVSEHYYLTHEGLLSAVRCPDVQYPSYLVT
ncbi:hypothetical protein EIP91_004609 [Steccherinum ochraceum]|uniref:Fungal-type protein kinase domain-containing protein n=1 Tax=Steccherinum ochraceum TaxID=92696 RepID=A0A4R0RWA9_9APHY|nr:hypothetical protein EIP91_004609 [Steccherinum ochraceum]